MTFEVIDCSATAPRILDSLRFIGSAEREERQSTVTHT
jgi:hypothetical protein